MYVCNEYRNSKKVGQILAVDGYFFNKVVYVESKNIVSILFLLYHFTCFCV